MELVSTTRWTSTCPPKARPPSPTKPDHPQPGAPVFALASSVVRRNYLSSFLGPSTKAKHREHGGTEGTQRSPQRKSISVCSLLLCVLCDSLRLLSHPEQPQQFFRCLARVPRFEPRTQLEHPRTRRHPLQRLRRRSLRQFHRARPHQDVLRPIDLQPDPGIVKQARRMHIEAVSPQHRPHKDAQVCGRIEHQPPRPPFSLPCLCRTLPQKRHNRLFFRRILRQNFGQRGQLQQPGYELRRRGQPEPASASAEPVRVPQVEEYDNRSEEH